MTTLKSKAEEAIETLVDNEPKDLLSYQELIECLCELSTKDFKNIVKIAKRERKTRSMIEEYFNAN